MEDDYYAAVRLQKEYPLRFQAIRYEDLSAEPTANVRDLFRFLGVHYHGDVQRFLESHTRRNAGGVSSTFRDSRSAPYHWRTELGHGEVLRIQEHCAVAMERWGYRHALNESHQRDFNPVASYVLE